ncbi:MAG: hypothetical protein GF334_09730 [Candidatus Altiarchaeales archaeon]|nr:hypothetical protein [Candidatus Altiarchaeales archaeon]
MRCCLFVFSLAVFCLGCINSPENKNKASLDLSDDQLLQKALNTGDSEACKKITGSKRKPHCFMEVAKKTADPQVCENIESLALANTCKQELSKRKSSQKQN